MRNLAILALLAAIPIAHAQQRTIYGPDGRVVGREVQSGNSTTTYGPSGSVVGRSTTDSQGTTTYFDARGRIIGRSSR